MKYFEVAAKCGHVGRGNYYEGHFFELAPNAKVAAGQTRKKPRVKKNHVDAILWVREVDEAAYRKGKEAMRNNPYFHCCSKWEQNLVLDLIREGIIPETMKQLSYRERKGGHYKDKRIKLKIPKCKGIRNPYKYAKYNMDYTKYELSVA